MGTEKLEALCKMALVIDPSESWHEEMNVSSIDAALKEVDQTIENFNTTSDTEDERMLISCTQVRKTTIEFFDLD